MSKTITEVCEKEGCSGNRFYVRTEEHQVLIKCTECGEEYEIGNEIDYEIGPKCGSCDSEIFKVSWDKEAERFYFNCIQCREKPQLTYPNEECIQVDDNEMETEEDEINAEDVYYKVRELESRLDKMEYKLDCIYDWIAEINVIVKEIRTKVNRL